MTFVLHTPKRPDLTIQHSVSKKLSDSLATRELSSHLLNGEGGAYHHDDDPKHHDGPGGESVPGVPVTTPTSGQLEVGGSGQDEGHGSSHQAPLGGERGGRNFTHTEP